MRVTFLRSWHLFGQAPVPYRARDRLRSRRNSSWSAAANHLRIKYASTIYCDSVFIYGELGQTFPSGRVGVLVVKFLFIVLERRILLELDQKLVPVRIPGDCVVLADVHCLRLRPVV